MNPSTTPHIPEDLLLFLEALYPDRCPTLGTSIDQVWAATGRAEVIRFLRSEFEQQREDALSLEGTNTP